MAQSTSAEDSRTYEMLNNIAIGAQGEAVMDNSGKSILVRGCDPVMAYKKQEKWYLHNLVILNLLLVRMMTIFLRKYQVKSGTLLYFAPGACRYNLQKQPIPGGRAATKGWGLDQYKQLVRERQGEECSNRRNGG